MRRQYYFKLISVVQPRNAIHLKSIIAQDLLKIYYATTPTGLRDLLAYDGPDMEDIFCLNFTVTEENYGEMKVVELKPGGENISVSQVSPVSLKNNAYKK